MPPFLLSRRSERLSRRLVNFNLSTPGEHEAILVLPYLCFLAFIMTLVTVYLLSYVVISHNFLFDGEAFECLVSCFDGAFEHFFAQVTENLKSQILKSSNF